MAFNKFADFLNRVFYEEERVEVAETKELTGEEMAKFEAVVSEEGTESVAQIAQKIIADSQVESDNDEYPDICNVQSVLETAGLEADHELVRKILKNFAKCDPEMLQKDGSKRKAAIQNAIDLTKKQAEALKAEKVKDEESLSQAEKEAEAACTEAIANANSESERAIEEEKARSAAIIAEIRQKTDEATEEAKKQRDASLESIAAQRAENEAALKKSANLVAETEKCGQVVINQIDTWLNYLT